MKHLPLIAAVILTSAVLGSGAYWGSTVFRAQAAPIAVAPHTPPAPPDIAAAAGLFGGTPVATATIAFKLKGVIEDGPESVAILEEDGKPALAVGVGQLAAPGVTVTEIHQRHVLLDMSGKPTRLDLPDGGSVGLEQVSAAPAKPVASVTPTAASAAPMLVTNTGAGAAPPVVQPARAAAPGLSNDQMRQQYEQRRQQEMEQMERARRAAGMAPPGSVSGPTT